jgi:hypothetical protein
MRDSQYIGQRLQLLLWWKLCPAAVNAAFCAPEHLRAATAECILVVDAVVRCG